MKRAGLFLAGLAVLMILSAGALIPGEAEAAVPQLINFQGILKDGSGNPVANGSYSVTFTIYDAASGGNNLWTETQSVSTSGGLFAVLLGSINPVPDSAFKGAELYLGMAVSPDPEMAPRQRIASVGYSYRVNSVDSALGGNLTGDVTVSGKVGVGTVVPSEQLEITGNLRLPFASTTAGVIKVGLNRFIHTRQNNTCVGLNAGNLTMTGNLNTAIGDIALTSNTEGHENTAIGYQALYSNTTGDLNTATGTVALTSNTTGSYNTASGWGALAQNSTGNKNTAHGFMALYTNDIGEGNTANGWEALFENTTGTANTAIGHQALYLNTTGFQNTAIGAGTLVFNTTGSFNTALGQGATVLTGNLNNATAIGCGAIVDASNKIRLGNSGVSVLESPVPLTVVSDRNQKENFRPVDGEEVLRKIRGFELTSWNYKGHDPEQFRHYGPTAQDFFAAFGSDGVGTVGSETTLNTGDMAGILMIAVQALEKRTAEVAELETRIEVLEKEIKKLVEGEMAGK